MAKGSKRMHPECGGDAGTHIVVALFIRMITNTISDNKAYLNQRSSGRLRTPPMQ